MNVYIVTYVIDGIVNTHTIKAVSAEDAINQLGNEIDFDSATAELA